MTSERIVRLGALLDSTEHVQWLHYFLTKRKMPKWHVKRAHHAHWLQPHHPPRYTVDSN